jgi:hypothetical protein
VIPLPFKNLEDRANYVREYMREWRKNPENVKMESKIKSNSRDKRKKEAIDLKGGKCEVCGYSKNMAALEFHHINGKDIPWTKERSFLRWRHDKFIAELAKCILICANCHREIHHPNYLNIQQV